MEEFFNHFNHNSYGYCYQNPVRLIDPNGKQVDSSDPEIVFSFVLGWIGDSRAGVKNLTSRVLGTDRRFAGNGFFGTIEIPKEQSSTIAGDVFDSTVGIVSARFGISSGSVFSSKVGPGVVSEIVPEIGKSLVRFGDELETVEGLAKQASDAEKAGFPHGVSTKIVDKVKGSDLNHKSAEFSDVNKVFKVIKTGKNPKHYTVELPKPVTIETTKVFNKLFKIPKIKTN